jgi:hypothetical protein
MIVAASKAFDNSKIQEAAQAARSTKNRNVHSVNEYFEHCAT